MKKYILYTTPNCNGMTTIDNHSVIDMEKSWHGDKFVIVKTFEADTWEEARKIMDDYFGYNEN